MQQDKEQFLNLKTHPARLKVEEAAWFLGFSPHEIPLLVSDGILKPLGHPVQNAPKFFALAALDELRRDIKWLNKASEAICQHWRDKKRPNRGTSSPGRNNLLLR
ncbi:MAG TPA: hypothetical protein VHY30_00355 [Verrucomicrobiae bacterium]|jgi:hypothetical protein|nr:hypothetical protein [Verrucomicrobiae bacterium]